MACTNIPLTEPMKAARKTALDNLREGLRDGTISVVVGLSGALAFKGWRTTGGLMDACAYRTLKAEGFAPLRMATLRAEAMTGRKVNENTINAGVHSHDGGASWDRH